MSALPLFLFTILLPLITIILLWRRPRVPVGAWLATLFAAAGITGFSVLTAPWGTFGLPVRYALIVLFVLALIVSLRRAVPAERKEESPVRAIVKVLLGFFFGGVALGVLRGHEVPPGAIDLAFPLRGGSFLIVHGGSTSPSNTYNADPQQRLQRYALDIVKLTPFGTRARGLFPSDPRAYAIFDAEVVSPCNGTVVSAVDGDHVVVRCGDVNVTLAYLRRGSVAVRPGATVTTSELLGRVGQSANTGEPHLHVYAERNGAAVPARFGGEWWVRNEVARR